MPIYIDNTTGVKYAYSTLGQVTETETADVISSPGVSGDIIILNTFTVNGKPYTVTSIGPNAFRNCVGLVSVVIPDSVTSIGDYAFGSCASLLSIVLPDSVTSIGYYAFGSCGRLSSIFIPDSVTVIGASAFYYCASLVTIVIPDNITVIGSNTFVCCSSLLYVTMPLNVTSIGANAFAYCGRLSGVVIPDTVVYIGPSAFSNCSKLLTIYIPPNVTSIGHNAFNSCVRMSSVRFTNNTISICPGAFEEISIPSIAYVVPGFSTETTKILRQYFTNIIVLQTPSVSYITPNEGANNIQTKVSFTGNYLTNITTALFGNNKAINIEVINDGLIEVLAPTRIDTGIVDVTLIDIYDKPYTISEGYTYKRTINEHVSGRYVWLYLSKGIHWTKNKLAHCIKYIWNTTPLLDNTTFVNSSS
jgi:hypothetical protein